MSKIPTAEEFCKSFKTSGKTWKENFHETMIEFAKLHVKAALEAAAEKAKIIRKIRHGEGGGRFEIIDKQSILSSYDLNEIK